MNARLEEEHTREGRNLLALQYLVILAIFVLVVEDPDWHTVVGGALGTTKLIMQTVDGIDVLRLIGRLVRDRDMTKMLVLRTEVSLSLRSSH